VLVAGLGVGNLFKQFPSLQVILKLVGICYLLYLAYKVATAPTQKLDIAKAKPLTFSQAALFQWVNPKGWIIAIGAIVTFSVSSMPYTFQVFIIALFFVLFGLPCTGLWLLFGSSLKKMLSNPLHLRLFNIAMAILLVTSLIPIFFELYDNYANFR
jgi:threonine/homoserine/homoserine lactone efflux protein